jgi:predicted O-methyltransferase YrrM
MGLAGKIIPNLGRAARDPVRAVKLGWRRLFPFGIKPKDTEAYRIGSWSYGKLDRVKPENAFANIKTAEVRLLNVFDRVTDLSADPYELMLLCALASSHGATRLLEIGTYDGNTTLNLAANTPDNAMVTTMDLPEDWDGKLQIDVPAMMVNVTDRNTVGRQYLNTPYADKIQQVYGDSARVDWSQLGGPFDFVFIDGCHHYDYVKSDTKNAIKHTRPGGLIVWHDYGMIEDVSRVVDEVAESLNVVALSGTRLVVGSNPKA